MTDDQNQKPVSSEDLIAQMYAPSDPASVPTEPVSVPAEPPLVGDKLPTEPTTTIGPAPEVISTPGLNIDLIPTPPTSPPSTSEIPPIQSPAEAAKYEFPRYQEPTPAVSPAGVIPVQNINGPESSPPIPGLTGQPKSQRSKLFMLLPLVAVIAIGLAALFFFKGRQSSTGPVTITYWGLFEPNSVFQQVINDYQTKNPKVTIKYEQQIGINEYRERLDKAILKDQGPDIFRIHLSWVPMFGKSLSPLPSSVYSAAEYEKTFYKSAVESLKFNGSYVAVPIYYDSIGLYYNEDLFRAAGQTPPTTWEQLIQTACTLTVRDQTGKVKTAGVALGTTNNVDHWSDILGLMLLQNKANLTNPGYCDERGVCPTTDALSFYTSFAKNSACRNSQNAFLGSVWSDIMPTSTYAFGTGQVAMYFGPSWRAFDLKNDYPNLNFKIIPVPQLSTDERSIASWATYWVESVSANSKNSTEAWKFLKYLSSKEVLEKLYLAQTNLGTPRIFGEPYPRIDMADMLKADPYVGAFIQQAPYARNWYLSSATGDNGINDRMIKYYQDAVNQFILDRTSNETITTLTSGVAQVLSAYGLAPSQ